ncbi:MAG: hypothetical protein AB7N76_27450 [Planctomycetota bacterium]
MHRGRIAAAVGLLAMGGFNTWYLATTPGGYLAVFPPFAKSNELQMFLDLTTSLTLVNVWIALDLKRRGQSLGWAGLVFLGTVLLGSIGPLVYFVLRTPPPPRAAAPVAASTA